MKSFGRRAPGSHPVIAAATMTEGMAMSTTPNVGLVADELNFSAFAPPRPRLYVVRSEVGPAVTQRYPRRREEP